jgi:hypothetical protein
MDIVDATPTRQGPESADSLSDDKEHSENMCSESAISFAVEWAHLGGD